MSRTFSTLNLQPQGLWNKPQFKTIRYEIPNGIDSFPGIELLPTFSPCVGSSTVNKDFHSRTQQISHTKSKNTPDKTKEVSSGTDN